MHAPISSPAKRRRGTTALFVVLVLVLVTLVVLDKVPTNDYALTPGNATPVAPLVKIDGVASETHHGKIMFTDVDLQSLNAFAMDLHALSESRAVHQLGPARGTRCSD